MLKDVRPLDTLLNLGPRSRQMLERAGIRCETQLRERGAILAYLDVKAVEPRASLNLLYALVGALEGRNWQQVKRSSRFELLNALEAARSSIQR